MNKKNKQANSYHFSLVGKMFLKEQNDIEPFPGNKPYGRISELIGILNAETIGRWRVSESRQLQSKRQIDIIDMFCGCGGVSAGFLALNRFLPVYRLAGAIDIDRYACDTFERNIGTRPLQLDIKSLLESNNLDAFLKRCKIKKKAPLILIGCPPCQGFSAHRKKYRGNGDERNNLVEIFAKVAAAIGPSAVFMENVPELLSEKHSVHFESVKRILEDAGYRVSAGIVNMAEFGVPQKRQRAVVLAAREEMAIPSGYLTADKYITVRQAISHLKPISSEFPSYDDPMHVTARHRQSTIEIIKKIPLNGGSRPNGVGPKCLDKVKGFSDVYGRLYWDKSSITITAFARNPASGRYVHPEQNRGLSIREAALLQSFPESYFFEGPFDDKFLQIGNAVPPRFSAFLAAYLQGKLAFLPVLNVKKAKKSIDRISRPCLEETI